MGYACEHCGKRRSMVYCRSDAACLCLSCDRDVHSANALSLRHSRTLICERCNSQPSSIRCIDENVSLCQDCDWIGHGDSNSVSSSHKRQAVNCYSGCLSAMELSRIWPFLQDFPSFLDSTCGQRIGSMSIADTCGPLLGDNNGGDLSFGVQTNDLQCVDNSSIWMESSMPRLDNELQNVEQPVGSTNSKSPKVITEIIYFVGYFFISED